MAPEPEPTVETVKDFWEGHVNNEYYTDEARASAFFDVLTFLVHGWRMDLIFFVSGVGTWFAMNSRKDKLMSDRFKRLIIPFIFGVIFIIPPQKFLEASSFYGFQGTYIDFLKEWPAMAFSFNFGPSVLFWFGHLGAHIFYLPYLFLMTLAVIPLYKLIKKLNIKLLSLEKIIVTPYGIFLLMLPMLVARIGLKPLFPHYTDWADFFGFIWMFLYGFLFVRNHHFMQVVKLQVWLFLKIGIISNVLLYYIINLNDVNMQNYIQPSFGLSHIYISTLSVIVSFCWVLFFVGLAAKMLNKNHRLLKWANEGILPIYILHQTVIVIFAYYIVQSGLSVGVKYLLVAGMAIPVSILIYLLVKNVKLFRFLFGLKFTKSEGPAFQTSMKPQMRVAGILIEREEG
jgi:hypothetical protein